MKSVLFLCKTQLLDVKIKISNRKYNHLHTYIAELTSSLRENIVQAEQCLNFFTNQLHTIQKDLIRSFFLNYKYLNERHEIEENVIYFHQNIHLKLIFHLFFSCRSPISKS